LKKIIIITAAGKGSRMHSEIPKQFLLLGKQPVLMHTMMKFYRYDPDFEIRLVLPAAQFDHWKKLCDKYKFTIPHSIFPGGETRFHSVKNSLQEIDENSITGIHDGVRPLVDNHTISRCYETAGRKGNAIPVIGVSESLRKLENSANSIADRNQYRIVQTPQVFQSKILLKAYKTPYNPSFTDDASVVEHMGYSINLVAGDPANIKITTKTDLLTADTLIRVCP